MRQVLAIGNSTNYEHEAFSLVRSALLRRGADATLFRQDECLEGGSIQMSATSTGTVFRIWVDGGYRTVDEFDVLWYLKPHLPRVLREHSDPDVRSFTHRQFHCMREALWHCCAHKPWLDNPWLQVRAENKPYQLCLAKECGLRVPDTLISSDPEEVRKFYAVCSQRMVVKQLATAPIANRVLYTNVVTPEAMGRIDRAKYSPSIYQRKVEKERELRVTIVGRHVFVAAIHSQGDSSTAVDWRRKPVLNDFDLPVSVGQIPAEVEGKLKSLLSRLGLRFGCVDLIVTPEGEHVFLEVNPNGQWCFIERRTGLRISEAIAETLLE